jgi:hypothetical protein
MERGQLSDRLPPVRIRSLMTVAVCGSLGISAGACSSLLGIEDPHSGPGGDGGMTDGPPTTGVDHLTLSLTSVQIAQAQRVRVRVTAVYTDSSMQDATGSATYESDNSVVASASAGQVEGGIQTGTAKITVSFGSKTAELMVAVSSKKCQPKINEFQTAGTTGTTPSADEWIEIVNPCAGPINVGGWTLVYRSYMGTADSTPVMITMADMMQPGDIRLYAGPMYSGTNEVSRWSAGGGSGQLAEDRGGIAIRDSAQALVDAVAYGGVASGHAFIEGNPLPTMERGKPAQRSPYDGRDGDDGPNDFKVATAVSPGTPGAPNAP